jgi:hypothetical protein
MPKHSLRLKQLRKRAAESVLLTQGQSPLLIQDMFLAMRGAIIARGFLSIDRNEGLPESE